MLKPKIIVFAIPIILSLSSILLCGVCAKGNSAQEHLNLPDKVIDDNVIDLSDTLIGGKKFIRRGILFDQSREWVWQVLIDPMEVKRVIPKLKKYEVLVTYPDSQIVVCIGKPHWLLKTYCCTLSLRFIPFKEIIWKQVSGDLRSLEGAWKLYELENGRTMAIYSIHFEPKSVIPQFLLEKGIKHDLRNVLCDVIVRVAKRSAEVIKEVGETKQEDVGF